MQDIIVEKPYQFVPPHRGTIWPRFLAAIVGSYLRFFYGVRRCECRGVERLGMNELGFGHVGASGVTVRKFLEGIVRVGDPQVQTLAAGQ